MIPTFTIDLTTVLAPFAYCAGGFVSAALALIIAKLIRPEHEKATSLKAGDPDSPRSLAA